MNKEGLASQWRSIMKASFSGLAARCLKQSGLVASKFYVEIKLVLQNSVFHQLTIRQQILQSSPLKASKSLLIVFRSRLAGWLQLSNDA